ncbi:phosphatidate cytidylyltransferase [Krasilnikovia cinnamomea]|uniref:Phosphatidate cytidylyltransferase n=1 Tax=Krasilnikovia cinnamomea TaxID=349313 RepID=A0A4Q7ZHN3_9ACTN|nr:phosphatidate cytidylyltransferase [Krasilnikovia cinnamomea]RZU49733.1 phosphatidate cytidylyltransferase [Krasilnikovia cinnamomea]
MSYLEPRGGHSPFGGRSPEPDVVAPYAFDEPAAAPDPYARYRKPAESGSPEDGWPQTPGDASSGPSTGGFGSAGVGSGGFGSAGGGSGGPGSGGLGSGGLGSASGGSGGLGSAGGGSAYVNPGWNDDLSAPDGDEPEPPRRRGPGRRRARRSGAPVRPRETAADGGAPPPAKPGGRAGRNLPAAIGVGVTLGAIVLGSLFWPPAFLAVVAAAASVGVWEMVRAVRAADAHPPLLPLLAGTLLMAGLAQFAGPDGLTLGLLVTVAAALVWRLGEGVSGFRRDLTAIVLIAVYVPFLLGFGVLVVQPDDGPWRVLGTLIAVVLSDTGGYASGVFLGRHKMAPSISPGKTWEGSAGSVVAAAVGSAIWFALLMDVPLGWGALFGAVISVVAITGDLAESMLKRDLGVKDMSNLLPGHGGLMDRLDSILFAVPTAYVLLSLIAPPG